MHIGPDKVTNIVSAVLGALGTVLMFRGTFGLSSAGAFMGDLSAQVKPANDRRIRLQRCGLALLTASFLLQAAAQFLPSE